MPEDFAHDATVSADMTSKGIFVVHAISSGGMVHKQTLLFEGGVLIVLFFSLKKAIFLIFLKMFVVIKKFLIFAHIYISEY